MFLGVIGVSGAAIVSTALPGRSVLGPVHESLALGRLGTWLVVGATCAAVVLELGGTVLWWRRRVWTIRRHLGWRPALIDLHHAAGIVGLVLMLTIAATGVMMPFVTPDNAPNLRRWIVDLHTARAYPWPVKAIWAIMALGFLVQAATGVLMWWKPNRRRAGAGATTA
jgi:uncharacterized iron-regulated membrane protein